MLRKTKEKLYPKVLDNYRGSRDRGDRTMRSLMVQAAGSLVNMATKGKLKSKQLTKWILKKQKEKMPWGKLVCAVAAKLLRIVRAVLISNKPYNSKIAGVAKCSLPKGS